VRNNPNIKERIKLIAVKAIDIGNPAKILGIERKANGALKKSGIDKYLIISKDNAHLT
jgi:hypothetical protein